MSNKKAEMSTTEIITLVLVVFVIILFVLFLFFHNSILDWLRQIPGYNLPKEDTEVNITLDFDGTDSCEQPIGEFKKAEGSNLENAIPGLANSQYIYFYDKNNANSPQDKSMFYFSGDNENNGVIIAELDSGPLNIGAITNKKVSIDPTLLNLDSIVLQQMRVSYLLGDSDFNYKQFIQELAKIDSTIYISGWLCKTNAEVSQEKELIKPAWPDESIIKYIPLKDLKLGDISSEGWLSHLLRTTFGSDTRKSTIAFPSYINLGQSNDKLYFSLRNILRIGSYGGQYIVIILPDGSIWFEDSVVSSVSANGEVLLRDSFSLRIEYDMDNGILIPKGQEHADKRRYIYYSESNLKILERDFNSLKELFEST